MHQSTVHRIFWGLILVGVGAAFLLNQTGVIAIDIGDLISVFWPVVLILVGVQGLLIQRHGGFWWNPVVIGVGVYFLGKNLGWFHWSLGDMMKIVIPVVLIGYGLCLIVRGGRSRPTRREPEGWNSVTPPSTPPEPDLAPPPPPPMPYDSPFTFGPEPDQPERAADQPPPPPGGGNARREPGPELQELPCDPRPKDPRYWKHRYWKEHHQPFWPEGGTDSASDNYSRFIGDFEIGRDYFELRPMSVSHFIGDTRLDLTRAQIPVGETKIYISSFIGDVKVFVPNDYSVGLRVVSSCLIGDVKVMEQKRGGFFNQMNVETPSFADSAKRIVLIVSTFIGDVRVTKVG
ncbi:cell wall-active antibiotics response protein LiaF [Cohnella thermotolerans]|uniref:cell wall-active antibiotics response protein LiaF n=1 Tax=Cohnella thermotolerans TaxID=329858 RepID=UPI0004180D47|nr:cell wall-active antibiotics response protein LiaF [Cohnella thermotolerans]